MYTTEILWVVQFMSQATRTFNVDRWASYTKQRYKIKSIYRYDGPWCNLTPAQRRRVIKKARKNKDHSIGVFTNVHLD